MFNNNITTVRCKPGVILFGKLINILRLQSIIFITLFESETVCTFKKQPERRIIKFHIRIPFSHSILSSQLHRINRIKITQACTGVRVSMVIYYAFIVFSRVDNSGCPLPIVERCNVITVILRLIVYYSTIRMVSLPWANVAQHSIFCNVACDETNELCAWSKTVAPRPIYVMPVSRFKVKKSLNKDCPPPVWMFLPC